MRLVQGIYQVIIYITHLCYLRALNNACPAGKPIENDPNCTTGLWYVQFDETAYSCCQPELPIDTGIEQLLTRSNDIHGIKLCSSDSDCQDDHAICGKKNGSDGKLLKWTTPDSSGVGLANLTIYEGLCIEAKPITFTYSMGFIDLKDEWKNKEMGRKYLPVGWQNGTRRDELKKCAKNEDCGGGQFCDNIYSLRSDKGNLDELYKYCFEKPELPIDTGMEQIRLRSTIAHRGSCATDDDCWMEENHHGVCVTRNGSDDMFERKNIIRGANSGVCIEAKPIALTFALLFQNLDVTSRNGEAGRKYLPVDWQPGKPNDELRECFERRCADGEFCDYVYSLNEAQVNYDDYSKYCYKLLSPEHRDFPRYPSTQYELCNINEDCEFKFEVCQEDASKLSTIINETYVEVKAYCRYCRGDECPPRKPRPKGAFIAFCVFMVLYFACFIHITVVQFGWYRCCWKRLRRGRKQKIFEVEDGTLTNTPVSNTPKTKSSMIKSQTPNKK